MLISLIIHAWDTLGENGTHVFLLSDFIFVFDNASVFVLSSVSPSCSRAGPGFLERGFIYIKVCVCEGWGSLC